MNKRTILDVLKERSEREAIQFQIDAVNHERDRLTCSFETKLKELKRQQDSLRLAHLQNRRDCL